MPLFKPFSVFGGQHSRSYSLFEIRLEEDYIILRGNRRESAGQLLKGVVVLCVSEAVKLEDCRLHLIGTQQTSVNSDEGWKVDRIDILLNHHWPAFIGVHDKSTILPKGNYEYPFQYTLPGDTVETIEGMSEMSITYWLEATVGRGKFAHNWHARKRLRIFRKLGSNESEASQSMVSARPWPNKIEYCIEVSGKAAVFGGSVSLGISLTPLLQGLEIGDITAELTEKRNLMFHTSRDKSLREYFRTKDLAKWRFKAGKEDHWLNNGDKTRPGSWTVSERLHLPTSLQNCVQDLKCEGVQVRHEIKVTVALINPDGHISSITAIFPIVIFMSSGNRLDEYGALFSQASLGVSAETHMVAPPPEFGKHVFDQLCDNVDCYRARDLRSRSVTTGSLDGRTHSRSVEVICTLRRSLSKLRHGRVPANLTTRHDDLFGFSDEQMRLDAGESGNLNDVPDYATAVQAPLPSRAQLPEWLLPNYQAALNTPRTSAPTVFNQSTYTLGLLQGEDEVHMRTMPHPLNRTAGPLPSQPNQIIE